MLLRLFMLTALICSAAHADEERHAMAFDIKVMDPCESLAYKAGITWDENLKKRMGIKEHCRRAKYYCPHVEEKFEPIMSEYMALVNRCKAGENIAMHEVNALPDFAPKTGYYCCFGFKAPDLFKDDTE